jgi:hypothetical protein
MSKPKRPKRSRGHQEHLAKSLLVVSISPDNTDADFQQIFKDVLPQLELLQRGAFLTVEGTWRNP